MQKGKGPWEKPAYAAEKKVRKNIIMAKYENKSRWRSVTAKIQQLQQRS